MLNIKTVQDEMIGMYEVLEDNRFLDWVESLEDMGNLIKTIQSIRDELLEDIESKDSFTQNIFYKWEKDVGNLLNLPGLWTPKGYKSWDDLLRDSEIAFSDENNLNVNSLYNVKYYLYGKFVVPDIIASIRYRAFSGCKYLTEIVLPETIQNIGCDAFFNCYSLKYLRVPKSVTAIKGPIVNGCTSLSVLEIPKKFRDLDNLFSDNLRVQIKYY